MSHLSRIIRLLPAAVLALVPVLAPADPPKAQAPAPSGVSAYLKDGRKVPLFGEGSADVPVAKVGGEMVTMRELGDALATAHASHGADAQAGKRDAGVLVDRLVEMRLVALEARAMGIADLPQYKAEVEAFRSTLLRDMLKEGYTRNLKPDPEKVQKLYRDAVREWKVRSAIFAVEPEARDFASRVKTVSEFQALAAEAFAQKKALEPVDSRILPENKMIPVVVAELRKLKPGQMTPPVKVEKGFAVVLLEATQYPDNQEQWAIAQWAVLSARHNEELRRQYRLLRKKYAQVDRALLKKIDFEAKKPGIEALGKDQRVLVRIEGEAPVTVADLTREVAAAYFHGASQAVKSKKKINQGKEAALDNLLGRRLFTKEALVRKIQDTPAFRHKLQDHENSLLFSAGVERAVLPEVRVTEADEKAYYQAHLSEYTYPRFLRLEGLAFSGAKDAQAALAKLRAGTDFKFLAQNADGQIKPEAAQLQFDGGVLSAADLPPAVQSSLAGAKTGDYRLHQEGGEHYVIHVVEEFPPRARPFEDARADAGKKIQAEKVAQAVKDWIAQLRKAYPIEVYLARVGE